MDLKKNMFVLGSKSYRVSGSNYTSAKSTRIGTVTEGRNNPFADSIDHSAIANAEARSGFLYFFYCTNPKKA